jgi:hypothetical protein
MYIAIQGKLHPMLLCPISNLGKVAAGMSRTHICHIDLLLRPPLPDEGARIGMAHDVLANLVNAVIYIAVVMKS